MKPLLEKFDQNSLNQKLTKTPLWLMRQAGRYLPEYRKIRQQVGSFMEMCHSPEITAEVTLQPIQRFGFDAAIIFADILLIPHALGQNVTFEEKIGPKLSKIPNWQEFFDHAQSVDVIPPLQPTLSSLQLVKAKLPDETTLIGFAGSPWTIATYMVEGGKSEDFRTILTWIDKHPERLETLLELLCQSILKFIKAQVASGAEIIQIFDTWAKVVPKNHQEKLILNPIRTIIQKFRLDYPDVPIIYFGKGVSDLYPKIAQGFSKVGFSFDQYTSPEFISKNFPSNMVVQGNLDPETLVQGGVKLEQEIESILNCFTTHNHIFNLGHGILPQTPLDHVYKLVEKVRSHRA